MPPSFVFNAVNFYPLPIWDGFSSPIGEGIESLYENAA